MWLNHNIYKRKRAFTKIPFSFILLAILIVLNSCDKGSDTFEGLIEYRRYSVEKDSTVSSAESLKLYTDGRKKLLLT